MAGGFTMDGGSLRLTIASIGNLRTSAPDLAKAALQRAAGKLHEEALKNVSLDDHSLDDLADLDHPYARRHGTIQAGALGHDGRQVHTKPAKPGNRNQTGDLKRALKYALLPSARPPGEAWVVYFDVDAAPHAVWVVQGTRLMLPRDVLWWTATDPRVQAAMMREVVLYLGKAMRSKAVLRFGAGGSPRPAAGSLAV